MLELLEIINKYVVEKYPVIEAFLSTLTAVLTFIWICLTYIYMRESKRPILQLEYDLMSKKRYYSEYEDNTYYEENDKDQLGTVFIITNIGESPALNISIHYADGVTISTPLLKQNENMHKFIVNCGAFVMVEYNSIYRKREYNETLEFVTTNQKKNQKKKFPFFKRKKDLYSKYKKEEKRRGIKNS